MQKKLILIIAAFVVSLFLGINSYAKEEKSEGEESKYLVHIFSLSFINDQEGWAAGDHGMIYHTTDGGLNWERQKVKGEDSFFSISFADNKSGWAVGNRGVIFHTSDGGKTWEKQSDPKSKILFCVKAISVDKAWASGDWGTLLYTSDGGKTWEDRTLPQDIILYGIDFQGEEEGWLSGEFGAIIHTADGGKTWNLQESGVGSGSIGIESTTLFSVSFTTPKEGVVVGIDGIILRTEDGGEKWEQIFFEDPDKRPLFDVKLCGNVAIAAGDTGKLIASIDSGKTWSQLPLSEDMGLSWFSAVSLSKDSEGIIRGIIAGRQSVAILTRNCNLEAVGYLPKIEVPKK